MKKHILLFIVLVLYGTSMTAEDSASLTELVSGPHNTICDRDAVNPVNLGPTGAVGWPRGNEILVTDIDLHSPADGILQENDILLAANGRFFGADARKSLGNAITESEGTARNGRLDLIVWRDARKIGVTINLPVLGDYSPNWPANCLKSKIILHNACEWLAINQLDNGLFATSAGTEAYTPCAVNGLLFLASGEPQYLENARRLAYYFVRNRLPKPDKGPGLHNWAWSYSAIFLSEYYLITGDASVIPFLTELQGWIAANQTECGSWSYGTNTAKPSEENQNQVGLACLLALVLMRECGIEVDNKTLNKSLKFFERFTYNESIAYGDHRPWAEPGGSGKDALAAIIFKLLDSKHRSSSIYFAQRTADLYLWTEEAPTGPYFSFLWSPIAASLTTDQWYRRFMNHWQWYYDLARRWDGSILAPPNTWTGGNQYTLRGPLFTTGAMGLIYGLGERRLQILGAPKSVFCKTKPSEINRKESSLLMEAAQLKLKTIELTLLDIEKNINTNNLALAKTQIQDLQILLGRDDQRLTELIRKISLAGSRHIEEAARIFEDNRYLCPVDKEARKRIEQLAADDSIGALKDRAIRELENSRVWPSYRNSFTADAELARYYLPFNKKEHNPSSIKIMDKLAHMPGRYWAYERARLALENTGIPREGSIWDSLIRPVNNAPDKWRYLYPAPNDQLSGWQTISFDDSQWNNADKLFDQTNGWDMQASRMLMRSRFELKTNNYDRLIIFCRTDTPAIVYLNGVQVATFLRDAEGFWETYKLSRSAATLLQEGTNILAMSAESSSGGIVMCVGLQAIKADTSTTDSEPIPLQQTAFFNIIAQAAIEPAATAEYDLSNCSIPELITLFDDNSELVRWYAAAAFETIGSNAIPKLVKALSSKKPLTTEYAVKALGYIGADASETIPKLCRLLKSNRNPLIRRAAADSIGYIAYATEKPSPAGKKVVRLLIKSLKDDDYNVRDSAAKALANIGPTADIAIPQLSKALNDREWWVRESAAKALTRIDPAGTTVRPILEKAAETETHRWVLKALGRPITGVDMPESVDKAVRDN